MHHSLNIFTGDAAVQDVLRECLQTFREVEEQLKAAQASLKPYIEVLNGLNEASVNKEQWGIETASHSRQYPHYDQTYLIPQSTQSSFGEYSFTKFKSKMFRLALF